VRDSAAVRKQVTDFATAYDNLVRLLRELAAFDGQVAALSGPQSFVTQQLQAFNAQRR